MSTIGLECQARACAVSNHGGTNTLTVSHRVSPNHSRKIFRLEKIAFLKRLVELLEIRHDKTWKDRQVHGLVDGQVMSPSSSNVT